MSTLPHPVLWWDENLVPRPALILESLEAPGGAAHLLVTLFAGPVGQLDMHDVPYCDVISPVAGHWSEIA